MASVGSDLLADQAFGGSWTEEKLDCLQKYLEAHRTIFRGNPRARYFTTWYVDAFAGTGERSDEGTEEEQYREGSALRALKLEHPFDRYLFIEKSKNRLSRLRDNTGSRVPNLVDRCTFESDDANEVLALWRSERDWKKDRAVVFLDPFGAQVRWETLQLLSTTGGVDLWYLFPLSATLRLLRRDGTLPEAWSSRLSALLGTDEWKTAFYEPSRQQHLFPDDPPQQVRTATARSVCSFVQRRLADAFPFVAPNPLILRNSKNSPMFAFCFAAANASAGKAAIRIASDIVGRVTEGG